MPHGRLRTARVILRGPTLTCRMNRAVHRHPWAWSGIPPRRAGNPLGLSTGNFPPTVTFPLGSRQALVWCQTSATFPFGSRQAFSPQRKTGCCQLFSWSSGPGIARRAKSYSVVGPHSCMGPSSRSTLRPLGREGWGGGRVTRAPIKDGVTEGKMDNLSPAARYWQWVASEQR